MPKEEHPLQALAAYLPSGAWPYIQGFLVRYPIHLTLTESRKSILGDYRPPLQPGKAHRISINESLNPYQFLMTLVHELAHLETFVKYGAKVDAHGKEWQQQFVTLLKPLIHARIWPKDVETPLMNYLKGPKASTCVDIDLYKALAKYDQPIKGQVFVSDLPINSRFKLDDGSVYVLLAKRRTRYLAQQVPTKKQYLFPAIYKVWVIENGS